jgi:hypothetical protein
MVQLLSRRHETPEPLAQATWKSELAVLIYVAVLVRTAVAARPLIAHYLAAPPAGFTWPEGLGTASICDQMAPALCRD